MGFETIHVRTHNFTAGTFFAIRYHIPTLVINSLAIYKKNKTSTVSYPIPKRMNETAFQSFECAGRSWFSLSLLFRHQKEGCYVKNQG